ncbi:MAG: RES family NAD+ phosphorylase [Pseudomonadota bacterium]
MRYKGLLYRALNPRYVREPLSGEGAALYGGRFNPKGTEALYCAMSVQTAIREANQVGDLQPTTLVSLRADIGPLFDSYDANAFEREGLVPVNLGDPAWRNRMKSGKVVPTQQLAMELIAKGYCGLIAPSSANGATVQDRNCVLWRWNDSADNSISVVDGEDRLGNSSQTP